MRQLTHSIVLACTIAILACADPGTAPAAEGPAEQVSLPGLLISETGAVGVAYVSLPPGTLTGVVSVRIRNVSRAGVATPGSLVVDGGFDPVAVAASEGDELDLAFTDGLGRITHIEAKVPTRRAPTVVRISPAAGRTDVALSVWPTIIFSEPVDPGSLTPTSVRLLVGGIPVEGSIGWLDAEPWVVAFVPLAPLTPETVYELSITQEVRDLEGDPLDAASTVTFTTSAADHLGHATYARVTPSFIPGTQHYVFYDNGRFGLRYAGTGRDAVEFSGRYSHANDSLTLDFNGWSLIGPWEGTAVLRGDSLIVQLNMAMILNDFEDGVYVRSP